jgi:hypothetical protein
MVYYIVSMLLNFLYIYERAGCQFFPIMPISNLLCSRVMLIAI